MTDRALTEAMLVRHTDQPRRVEPGMLDLREGKPDFPAADQYQAYLDRRSNVDHSSGSMISLDLDPAEHPDVADPHVTIVYLGKDVPEEKLDAISARVADVASKRPPVQAMIGGQGTFTPSESSDFKTPVFAKVNAPGLDSLRAAFEDLNASQHTEFHPHMTQTYVAEGEPLPEPMPQTPVTFTHLSLHRGNDVEKHPFATGA